MTRREYNEIASASLSVGAICYSVILAKEYGTMFSFSCQQVPNLLPLNKSRELGKSIFVKKKTRKGHSKSSVIRV